jgi:phage/plasmid-associated DNA primase
LIFTKISYFINYRIYLEITSFDIERMDKILELVDYDYTIMSVGGQTIKQPLNRDGLGLKAWQRLPHSEIMKHFNDRSKRFGLRTGKQGNDRYIGSLDWDCCGKKGKDGRMGCDYTKEKLQKYNDIKTRDDGMFKGGTAGNFNLLFDFTDIPELVERFQQLIDEGRQKIELNSFEIFYSNGSHQVIPPSATKCKITNEIGASRQFLNERPFIVLTTDMPETNYILEALNEYDTMEKKPVVKKTAVRSITPLSSEDEKEVYMTDYDDMIINGLGKKRLKYNEYLRLASVLKSNNVSYDIWDKWNRECCNVDDDDHIKLWRNCVIDTDLKMSFVVGMCKEYDREYYNKWRMKQTSFMIDECVKDEQKMLWCDFNVKVPKRTCFTDVAFGDIFKRLYGDKFRFTNGFIYHFNGVYWERDNKQKSNINCFIDNVFYQDLKKWILGKILYWTKKAGETEDDDKNNKGIAFWTRVNLSVKDYIKTQRTKAELIKAIESKVCNDSQEWDLNPYIFVFNNCVFDLKLGKKVEPNPQDFMTTCCGWDYDDNYNDVGIDKFIETIQTDKSVRDYLMKAYYSCMTGIQSRNVYILTGSGGNGKSVLDELLMSMLGGYGYALPKAFLTQPFKDGANPEAIALHNKRCVIVSEPDAKKNICCSSLKALSGDSKISSRKLYGEIESVNIVATSIVECNTPPNLDEMNDAMSDRLGEGVIDFKSKFVKQSVYDTMSEDERVGISVGNDYYGEDAFKIESRQSLFNYLLGYRDKKVAVPNSVKQSSKKYLAKSDIFYDWFCDNYEVDNENVIKVKDIYYEFKNDNYDVLKTDKKTYGTEKNFISALRGNIFIKKYFKERDAYYNREQLKSNSLVGWKKKEEKEEDDRVCDDASTIVDE